MKTKRIRIAVVMNEHGHWSSAGWSNSNGDPKHDADLVGIAREGLEAGPNEAACFVEAEVPIPEPITVEGVVTPGPAE